MEAPGDPFLRAVQDITNSANKDFSPAEVGCTQSYEMSIILHLCFFDGQIHRNEEAEAMSA